MNTIKIHEGGFINEYPITNIETHIVHDALLESHNTIYNKDLKELQEPELLAPQQIVILNKVINDLKEDICKLEETLFVNKKNKKISENIEKIQKLIIKTENLINEKLDYEKIKETLCKLEEDFFIANGLLENDVTYKRYITFVKEHNNTDFKILVPESNKPEEPKGVGWFASQITKMTEKAVGKIKRAIDILNVNLNSVNKVDINKELPEQIRTKYNNYKSNFFTEKFEENTKKYNSLMENILPFNIFDSELFKPLQEYDGARIKNFIVINKDNYELFRYNNTPIENYYLINEDYSFTKIEPKVFIEKKNYYPVFYSGVSRIHSLFMEGLICYSNKDNVLSIIKFLYKYEPTFVDWIKNYYIYIMETNILLTPKSPTIFKTIILANGINHYINFYRVSYNTITYNFSDASKCEQVLIDKFNKIYLDKEVNEDIIKTLRLLIKEVTIDENTIIKLIYGSNIINKEQLCNFLYAISMNFKLIKNDIISAYNFLNITYYYEILKSKFIDRTDFIAELSNINYMSKSPKENNVYSLYDVVIDGTKYSILEALKMIKKDLFKKK